MDHVIPHAPVGQWVLLSPVPQRALLAAQHGLVTPVLQVVQRALTHHMLDSAQLEADEDHGGAITLIQRVCPGRYMALLEIKLCIAMLLQRFDILGVDVPDGAAAREQLQFTMSPVGLRMRLHERTSAG